MVFQNHLAHGLLLILVNRFTENSQIILVFRKSLFQLFGDVSDIFFTNLLFIRKYCRFHFFRRHDFLHLFEHFFRNRTAFIRMFRSADFRNDLIDERDNRLVNLMSLINRLDDPRFRNLICTGFDHHNLLGRGCNGHFQITLVPLFLRRIDDKFSIHHTHLRHRTGAVERNIGNARSDRRAEHRYKFRAACRVNAHNHIVQRNIVSVIFRKQRPHRSVDDTACQNGILGCLAFSLIKSARNFTYRIQFFFIFHAAREKVNSFSRFLRSRCRR